jgi:hypothetical protein
MNTIREIEKINEHELERGIAGTPASWHAQYANSAWCYVGNLDLELTEGVFGSLTCIVELPVPRLIRFNFTLIQAIAFAS